MRLTVMIGTVLTALLTAAILLTACSSPAYDSPEQKSGEESPESAGTVEPDCGGDSLTDTEPSEPDLSKLEYRITWVNYATDEAKLIENCLNQAGMFSSIGPHYPVFRFMTRAELENFTEEYSGLFSFDHSFNGEFTPFSEIQAEYGEDYFTENLLVIAYVIAPSGSFRYGVRDYAFDGECLLINICRTNDPENYTDDMAGWFVILELKKSEFGSCPMFDAIRVD